MNRSLLHAFVLIPLVLTCFALAPQVQAICQDTCLTNGNTVQGDDSLISLTTGTDNTALGFQALNANTTGGFNTANGARALLFNTTGSHNVALGANALVANISAHFNVAIGTDTLSSNTVGSENTAIGDSALISNTNGFNNVALGLGALHNNTTGSNNVALGLSAGFFQTTGSNNVYIGGGLHGVAGENNTIHIADSPNPDVAATACYIAGIFGRTSANGVPVLINSSNQLGTMTSSQRFKEDIKPMAKASEGLFALKPVSFRYKKEIDPKGTSQLGLVAEDVEKVNPDLVIRDKEGRPYSVRYDQVNAMLLNEFLKEHKAFLEEQREVQEQAATITQLKAELQATSTRQQKQIEALTAGLQKVSAQLQLSKPAPQTVLNDH